MTSDTSISGFRELLRSWTWQVVFGTKYWMVEIVVWAKVVCFHDTICCLHSSSMTNSQTRKKKWYCFGCLFFTMEAGESCSNGWEVGPFISFLSQENPEKPQQQDLCLTECSMGSIQGTVGDLDSGNHPLYRPNNGLSIWIWLFVLFGEWLAWFNSAIVSHYSIYAMHCYAI